MLRLLHENAGIDLGAGPGGQSRVSRRFGAGAGGGTVGVALDGGDALARRPGGVGQRPRAWMWWWELIGGSDGPARTLVEAVVGDAGKPVVTANKALLAVHGAGAGRCLGAAGGAGAAGVRSGGGWRVSR